MTDVTLSIQLYTLRHVGDLSAQLDVAARAGFSCVEPIGTQLDNPRDLRAALDAHGMTAPSSHASAAAIMENTETILENARSVGIGQIFLSAPPENQKFGRRAAWLDLAAKMDDLARRFADRDIALGYHNHHWELLECEDGRTGLEILLDETAGSGLTWEGDLAWIARARQDPMTLIKRYGDRLTAVHVKDIAPAGTLVDEDGWTAPPNGTMDWTGLYDAARRAGTRLFIAEHDLPANPATTAQAIHDWMAAAGNGRK